MAQTVDLAGAVARFAVEDLIEISAEGVVSRRGADMGADIARQKSVSSMLIMAAAFVLSCVCKVNVVYIVLGCIALGTARTLLGRRKAG